MTPLTESRSMIRPHREAMASASRFISRVLLYTAFLIITFLVLLPVLWIVVTSLKPESAWLTPELTIFPETPIWRNYYEAIVEQPFFQHAINTLVIAIPSVILTVLSSSLVGFGFARHNVPWKNTLFVLVLAMMMVPRMVTTIPQFILYARLHLTDTYWPWYLTAIAGGGSFNIFLFRQFFSTFPTELEDAAAVDGCSRFRTYWQIFMPNSLPAVAATAIFHFQWIWGDWFAPMIYLSPKNTTLSVLLTNGYRNPMGFRIYTVTLAAIVVYLLPMIFFFLLMQRYIIKGIVTTGIKS